jgi:transcriptional regulator with XRE-family HTH domain
LALAASNNERTFALREMWKRQVRELLKDRFQDEKSRRASYSLRDLAAEVGLSSGALSEIMSGKRKLSPKIAKRVVTALGLGDGVKEELLEKINKTHTNSRDQLTSDAYDLIANWIYFAILSILEHTEEPLSSADLSQRLDVTEPEAIAALDILQTYALVQQNAEGAYIAKYQGGHKEAPQIADGLEKKSVVTSLTFRADEERLAKAQENIRRIRELLHDGGEDGDDSERPVYRMNIQLLPVHEWKKRHAT